MRLRRSWSKKMRCSPGVLTAEPSSSPVPKPTGYHSNEGEAWGMGILRLVEVGLKYIVVALPVDWPITEVCGLTGGERSEILYLLLLVLKSTGLRQT